MNKKTYILTEDELAFFLGMTDDEPNSFSPEIFAQIRLDKGDFPGSLSAKGLIAPRGDGFIYTADGQNLVNALLRPESAAEIEKKSEKTCFYVFTSGGEYVLFNVIADGRCMAVIFPEAEDMEELLDKCFTERENGTFEPFGVTLGYDEWFMFLLTQFFFMQRQASLKRPLERDEMWIDVALLDMPEVIAALKSGASDTDVVQKLSDEACRREICRKLGDAGILEVDENDGMMLVRYTQTTVKWLDNDRSAELINVTSLKKNASRRVMYTVRQEGIVSLEQSSDSVCIKTTDRIRWREFL